MNLPAWLPLDKLLHFVGGLFIAGLFGGLDLALAGLVAAFVIGGLKEQLVDLPRPDRHTFDGWDAYWTGAGGLVGFCALQALA